MAINGHHHTNHLAESDGIIYLDVNTVKNGLWLANATTHYNDEHTFKVTEYDCDGNKLTERIEPLNKLWMSKNTWFFDHPLSAIITISENGDIVIEGDKTNWVYGIVPEKDGVNGCETQISNGKFNLNI